MNVYVVLPRCACDLMQKKILIQIQAQVHFFQDVRLQLAAPNHSTSLTQSKAELEVTDCNTATPSNLSEHSFFGFSS